MLSSRLARARPLLGFGAGTFEYAYPRYGRAGFARRAHQSYLQYAAELVQRAASPVTQHPELGDDLSLLAIKR